MIDLTRQLLEHFTRAAQIAIDDLHNKGISVHTQIGDSIIEVPPNGKSAIQSPQIKS